jgi:uncharacterized iron-regulated membrane protein
MFRNLRILHRWIGIISSLFMVLMAGSGLFLALKKKVDWIQPPSQKGEQIQELSEIISIESAGKAAFAVGLANLKALDDVDRFELHAGKSIYKITSKENFHEVQVDAKTGKVLSVAKRNDQLIEKIHDMSFFSGFTYDYLLPLVSISLLFLGLSGIYMFFTPVYRRWKFKRSGGSVDNSKSAQV